MNKLSIKKLWIDPESGTGTIFDEHYKKLKDEHGAEFETFKDFVPHLLIPQMLLIAVLEYQRAKPKDGMDDWMKGWNACLFDIREKLIVEEITIRHVK